MVHSNEHSRGECLARRGCGLHVGACCREFPCDDILSFQFFEFVQRDPSPELLKELETASNRESWFRDRTFLGLYGEKEDEYKRGKATPFIPDALAEKIAARLKGLEVWEIGDDLLDKVEADMLEHAAA